MMSNINQLTFWVKILLLILTPTTKETTMKIQWMKRKRGYIGGTYHKSKPIKGIHFDIQPDDDGCCLHVRMLGFGMSLEREYTTVRAAMRGAQRIINKLKH
jgi:hypothetical protein